MFDSYCAELFLRKIKMYLHFLSFLNVQMTQVFEIILHIRQYLLILHSQYHGCWWPSDARSQGIRSHAVGLLLRYYKLPMKAKRFYFYLTQYSPFQIYIHGSVQNCVISIAEVLEIMQSCAQPRICVLYRLMTQGSQGISRHSLACYCLGLVWCNATKTSATQGSTVRLFISHCHQFHLFLRSL